MTRTIDENKARLKMKAPFIRDQKHFDQVMALFPLEIRQQVYDEVKPLLAKPFTLTEQP